MATRATTTSFDRAEIFRSAWAAYRRARPTIFAAGDETGARRFLPSLFAKMLRSAWTDAKAAARHAVHLATAATFVEAQRRSRVAVAQAMTPGERSAAITRACDDLTLLDYAPLGVRASERRAHLKAELAALSAA